MNDEMIDSLHFIQNEQNYALELLPKECPAIGSGIVDANRMRGARDERSICTEGEISKEIGKKRLSFIRLMDTGTHRTGWPRAIGSGLCNSA